MYEYLNMNMSWQHFVPDFSSPPTLLADSGRTIASAVPHKIPSDDNYTRQVAWSTDPAAAYLASMHNDRTVRLWPSSTFLSGSPSSLDHAQYTMAESLTDMAWTSASSDDGPMLAAACSHQPIHLVSPAATGVATRLATYAAYDHLDQLTGPTSLSFHPWLPGRLVAGYPGGDLHAFDLSRPSSPVHSSPRSSTRLGKAQGRARGIVSHLTHLPHYSSLAMATYTAGHSLALADAHSLSVTHVIRDLPPATSVATDPASSTYVVSAHRNGLVVCHDVRDVRGPVWTLARASRTNLRSAVQVLDCGHWVVVAACGPWANEVHVVDLLTGTRHVRVLESGTRDVLAACHVVGGGRWWATGQGCRRFDGDDESQTRDNGVKVWEVRGEYRVAEQETE